MWVIVSRPPLNRDTRGGRRAAAGCDSRIDIFAFGAILYHLATGRFPYGSQAPWPNCDGGSIENRFRCGRLTYHVLESDKPASALLDYARMNDVDQILIGAQRSGATMRMFAGVSTQVAAEAPCNVTVVRPRADS